MRITISSRDLGLFAVVLLTLLLAPAVSWSRTPSPLENDPAPMQKKSAEEDKSPVPVRIDWKTIQSRLGAGNAILVTDPNGRILHSHNAGKPMIPASTLKLLTALLALDTFGPQFCFKTELYLSAAGDIILKGFGDPYLVSEAVATIADKLALQLPAIKDIIIDRSYYADTIGIPGTGSSSNPYNAGVEALSVNFNTVFFEQSAAGHYQSAEPQTPLLPFAVQRIRASGLNRGRIILNSANGEIWQYTGHLFQHFFQNAGIRVEGAIRLGQVDPNQDRLVMRHLSPLPMTTIISGLMDYSNNYIANQLLLAVGAAVYGPPATLEKGLLAARTFAEEKLGLIDFQIQEGSGLSRGNRFTADQLLRILNAFEPHYTLLKNEGSEYFKTGTLTGVRTRVGFIENNQKQRYRYVVLINTPDQPIEPVMRELRKLGGKGK
jgi:serine-type D-Ala-D-Ala carboxypeptidase/endopeptidase (penicillin-binding protein 4)